MGHLNKDFGHPFITGPYCLLLGVPQPKSSTCVGVGMPNAPLLRLPNYPRGVKQKSNGSKRRRYLVAGVLAALPALAFTTFASAGGSVGTELPTGLEAHTVASGLNAPVAASWAPDGRLFIAEKQGVVKVVLPGESPRARTLIDLSSHVATYIDRGLLGIAVDSDFAHNGYLWLLYTYDSNPASTAGAKTGRLSRITVGTGATVAAGEVPVLGVQGSSACPTPSSLLDCMPSDGMSHSIGTVRSDPDGTLWVGIGDGVTPGSLSSTIMRTLNPNVMSGAIMHVDRNGKGLRVHPFCPKTTNLSASCTKVFAKGFRNPFRFTLLGGGKVAVGDVGFDTTEELDIATGGKSFGWPCREGAHPQGMYANTSACKKIKSSTQTNPVYEYPHAGDGASIMTGPVLGSAWPVGKRGRLTVGDYARGTLGLFDIANPAAKVAPLATGLQAVVDMEPAPGGGITMVEAGFTASGVVPGRVWILEPAGANQRPWLKPVVTVAGQTASFEARAYDADSGSLTYDWDFGDGTTGTGSNPSHDYATPGVYLARVTVSDGSETGSDVVPVAAGLDAPNVVMASPTDGAVVTGGQRLNLSGSATLNGVPMAPSSLSWTLVLHHGSHDHFLTSFNGTVGSVEIPDDHNVNSSFDLVLRAKTSDGQSAYVRRPLHFKARTLNLSTSTGGKVGWAGNSVSGAAVTAVGLKSGLTVPATVTVAGKRWKFTSWSDGVRSASRTFTMPDRDVTLRANYVRG